MDETLSGGAEPAVTAGDRLRAAREAAGMSLADVAARTRISLRQLEAVEQARYTALPSPTYAVGFAKAYARTVGADEVSIAASVREEIGRIGPRPAEYAPYELPDPARVPSRGLAILGAGAALAVLILLALWYGTDLFRSGPATPEPTASGAPTVAAAPAPVPAPVPSGGKVTLTANDDVWMRVYDADDKTLFLGTMKPGDHFDVPADAKDPMINVGRPDKLTVTLDGKPVPSLGSGGHAIKDVKVGGIAIAALVAGSAATPTSPTTPAPAPTSTQTSSADEPHHRREPDDEPRARRTRHRALTETQRANLEAAAAAAAPASGNSAP